MGIAAERGTSMAHPSHQTSLVALKRVEGQIRGVQRMVEEGQYCVDILHQIHAAVGALARVEDAILERHLNHCVANALRRKDGDEKTKIDEVMQVIRRFRKGYR